MLLTLVFGEVPYFRYTEAINREYCDRHGYGFQIARPGCDVRRSPIWQKVEGVQELLSSTDYVLFIDADAYVHDQAKRIEDLIAEHMGDAAILLGTDRRDRDFAWSDENANCGVFLVRSCDKAAEILAEWWNVPFASTHQPDWFRPWCKQPRSRQAWLWRWPSEQGPFNAHVRLGPNRRWIRTIHYAHLNGTDGTFIRHLIGFTEEERLIILRRLRPNVRRIPAPLNGAAHESWRWE